MSEKPSMYTGRTVAGGVATIECPPWCHVDHGYWGDDVDDLCHVGKSIELTVPDAPAPAHGMWVPPLLAELSVYTGDPNPSGAVVLLSWGETKDRGVDLDVAGCDAMLEQLDSFRRNLMKLRGTLASIHEDRRRTQRLGVSAG